MRDPQAECPELLVERCFHLLFLLEALFSLSLFGLCSHCGDAIEAVSLYDDASPQQEILRIGGLLAAFLFWLRCLSGEHLSGEGTLIDTQRLGGKDFSVGRHLIAVLQSDNIAHHHVTPFHLKHLRSVLAAVGTGWPPQHLHHPLILFLIEQIKLAVGFHLKDEADAGSQHQRHEHARWLHHRHP